MGRTMLKVALFGPVSRLPVSLAARILPRALHEPFVRFQVQAGERMRGGAFLAATMLGEAPTPRPAGRARGAEETSSRGSARTAVLVGGPARVGKSVAAKRLADRLGYGVLNTDRLHEWYGVLGGHTEVREFREGWMRHLLETRSRGVVVEGALLVMEGRHDTRDARICLGAFERWCRDHRAVGFTVGCAVADRIDRLRAVEEHLESCWTERLTRRERWRVVRHVAYLSTSLRDEAARRGVAYREISPGTFERDVQALVDEAEAAVVGSAPAPGHGGSGLHRVPAADAPGEERQQGESEASQEGAHPGVARPD